MQIQGMNDVPPAQIRGDSIFPFGHSRSVSERVRTLLGDEVCDQADPPLLRLVLAPSGFAKSSSVNEWLRERALTNGDCVRIRSTPRIPSMFWESMSQALAPHSGSEPTTFADPFEAASELARGLRSSLTLVVDDFHRVTSAPVDLALVDLALNSPKLMLVVIGRHATVLDGPLVSSQIRTRRVRAVDLRVPLAEALLAASSFGATQEPELFTALELAEGWPLAVHAILRPDEPVGSPAGMATDPSVPDPMTRLSAFALQALETVTQAGRVVLFAAAQLNAIGMSQISEILADTSASASATVQQLLDTGLLVPASQDAPHSGRNEFRCHASVNAEFAAQAKQTLSIDNRRRLERVRARELARSDPATALHLFCAAEDFDAAEHLLARRFSLITHDVETCAQALRTVPHEELAKHPTLTAGLLLVEQALDIAAPSRLRYLFALWKGGLEEQLPAGVASPEGPIHLELLCQSMVMHRWLGNLVTAGTFMRHLESRLSPEDDVTAPTQPAEIAKCSRETTNLSRATYYMEIAATSLTLRNFSHARHLTKRIQRQSEQAIAKSNPTPEKRAAREQHSVGNQLAPRFPR